MAKTTHTPGPWKVTWLPWIVSAEIETVNQTDGKYRHLTNQLPMLAGPNVEVELIRDRETGFDHRYSAEACANARLMAAAPDLLRICQAIARLNEGQDRANMCEIAGQARQTIFEATGEINLK